MPWGAGSVVPILRARRPAIRSWASDVAGRSVGEFVDCEPAQVDTPRQRLAGGLLPVVRDGTCA